LPGVAKAGQRYQYAEVFELCDNGLSLIATIYFLPNRSYLSAIWQLIIQNMGNEIVGRENEIVILHKLLMSKKPELLAIYGRRRIGKTYLIKTYYKENLSFSCSGQFKGKTQEQLINFTEQLNTFFPDKQKILAARTWQEAFQFLKERLNSLTHSRKKVIFLTNYPGWIVKNQDFFLHSVISGTAMHPKKTIYW
jgi:hypothetical protein